MRRSPASGVLVATLGLAAPAAAHTALTLPAAVASRLLSRMAVPIFDYMAKGHGRTGQAAVPIAVAP